MHDSLGERIKEMRLKRGMKINELAEKIRIPLYDEDGQVISYKNYTGTSISYIENNKQRPSIDVVMAISDCLRVSIDWLARGEEYTGEEMKSTSQEQLHLSYEVATPEQVILLTKKINDLGERVQKNEDRLSIVESRLEEV
ncbi:hypothetical protein C1I60_12780 [Paenibacillus terrae]|uniref:HTH cro/C1-type domain-containing protein n=1 Tax=Paenibacillus terrae TaxID=159743 RepID=A0A4V5SQ13_9BACL|nr:helix-turn-helix transcriptional regulator [Paenibacillus terrae]TKH44201.1 hypothetical protein C1I60_12780 [Paenibacillus terrae]